MRIGILSIFLFVTFPVFSTPQEEIVHVQGQGRLDKKLGQLVLHLKGSPYQRGYQHGVLLKEQIQRNIATYIDGMQLPIAGRIEEFSKHIHTLLSFVPDSFIQEMKGVAEGSQVHFDKIVALNLFPEMFHCSGITVSGQATLNHELYHVRVLDYSIGKGLQTTAVLQVVEPEGKIPYLNVSYAGFIGSVTGMNQEKIAVGEIGGYGYGSWKGIPMAFLIREILENAYSLSDAQTILYNAPRTCEYYYVISDGKTQESFGAYATADQLHFFAPGDSYALLSPPNLPENYGKNGDNDKFVLSSCSLQNTRFQTLLYDNTDRLAMLARLQPPDALLLTGAAYPERYPVLVDRVLEHYGKINEQTLMEIIKLPIARISNLHNAIFHPAALKIWIANAGPNEEPACNQPYHEWDLPSLLAPN